jgi:hypothetical protein
MKTITETYILFEFSELSEVSREKAIDNTITAWLECNLLIPNYAKDNFQKAIIETGLHRIPLIASSCVLSYCENDIIRYNSDFLYTISGNVYCHKNDYD